MRSHLVRAAASAAKHLLPELIMSIFILLTQRKLSRSTRIGRLRKTAP
jgi:hypothetical protein